MYKETNIWGMTMHNSTYLTETGNGYYVFVESDSYRFIQ